jgi:hypothetical protein
VPQNPPTRSVGWGGDIALRAVDTIWMQSGFRPVLRRIKIVPPRWKRSCIPRKLTPEAYADSSYPESNELFKQQAREPDHSKREPL